MYKFYDGESDPRLNEYQVQSIDDVETYNAVECPNGCGWWMGDCLENGQCPECGDCTHEISDDHFDD